MKKILLVVTILNLKNGVFSTSSLQQETQHNDEFLLYSTQMKQEYQQHLQENTQPEQQQQLLLQKQRQQQQQEPLPPQPLQQHQQHNTISDENFNTDSSSSSSNNNNLIQGSPLDRGPFFDISASRNVTALVGKTAYLNCRIKNLGNKTVTWIRHRDLHLLTVGRFTYTSDQRFQSVHNPQTGDWSLQVRYTQKRDSGIYECQVSTTPPIGHIMTLSVVEPITTVVGGPDLYIDTGSTVNLTCIVRHLPEPPPAIYWTHNNEEINYDSPRGGVSVITEKGDITTSYLLIQRARISDSGKYTCSPSSANPETINVHILNGEQPAAIQEGNKSFSQNPYVIFFLSLLIITIHR